MCTPFMVFRRLWYSDVPGVNSVVNHWSFVQLAGAFDSFADHVEAVKDKRRRVERSLSTWKHPGLRRCMQRWLEYMNIVAEERMEEAQEMTRKLMHEELKNVRSKMTKLFGSKGRRKERAGRGRLEMENAVLSTRITGARAGGCKGASGPDAGSESSVHGLIPVPRKRSPNILQLAHLL